MREITSAATVARSWLLSYKCWGGFVHILGRAVLESASPAGVAGLDMELDAFVVTEPGSGSGNRGGSGGRS